LGVPEEGELQELLGGGALAGSFTRHMATISLKALENFLWLLVEARGGAPHCVQEDLL